MVTIIAKRLLSICMGIQGFLKFEKETQFQLLSDAIFLDFRNSLDVDIQRLAKNRFGSNIKKTEVISEGDENKLWNLKLLWSFNPRVLVNILVFLKGKNVGLRGGVEHRNLKHSNISFGTENGTEYIQYTEDMSKTNQGGLQSKLKSVRQV